MESLVTVDGREVLLPGWPAPRCSAGSDRVWELFVLHSPDIHLSARLCRSRPRLDTAASQVILRSRR